MKNRSGLKRTRCLSVLSALVLFLGVGFLQTTPTSVSAQSLSNSILEVVPSTPLSSITSGGQGQFYLEAQVFLNRTVNTSDCTVATSLQDSFFNGGNLVGTMRIWGMRTGANTGNATNTVAGTQATNLSNTALAVVNISLDLPSFNGTLEMQGTLGKNRQNFENLITNSGIGLPTTALPLQDTLAITGGTGVFRGASGEALLSPLLTAVTSGTTTNNVNCSTGAFRLTLSQVRRSSVFNIQ